MMYPPRLLNPGLEQKAGSDLTDKRVVYYVVKKEVRYGTFQESLRGEVLSRIL